MKILILTQYLQLSGPEGYPGNGILYGNSFQHIFKELVLVISLKLFDLQRTIFFQNVANSKLISVTILHFLIFRAFLVQIGPKWREKRSREPAEHYFWPYLLNY